jgi:hypothetical protein
MKITVTRVVEINGKRLEQTASAEFTDRYSIARALGDNIPTPEASATARARALFASLIDENPTP